MEWYKAIRCRYDGSVTEISRGASKPTGADDV